MVSARSILLRKLTQRPILPRMDEANRLAMTTDWLFSRGVVMPDPIAASKNLFSNLADRFKTAYSPDNVKRAFTPEGAAAIGRGVQEAYSPEGLARAKNNMGTLVDAGKELANKGATAVQDGALVDGAKNFTQTVHSGNLVEATQRFGGAGTAGWLAAHLPTTIAMNFVADQLKNITKP
jgi:hypothetical protein